MWGSDPSLLGENLCSRHHPQVCGSSPGEPGSCLCWVSALPASCLVVPSSYLWLWKISWASLLAFLFSGFSVNSCDSGVSMRGGEVRSFLIYHVQPSLPSWPLSSRDGILLLLLLLRASLAHLMLPLSPLPPPPRADIPCLRCLLHPPSLWTVLSACVDYFACRGKFTKGEL